MWAEVLATDGSGDRWVAVDPVHSKCDSPEQLIDMWYGDGSNGEVQSAMGSRGKGKGKCPPYVVAVTCCPMLRVTEVSKRYLRDWFSLVGTPKRVQEAWWADTLSQVSCAATAGVEAMETLDADRLDAAAMANARKRMPKTLAAMKRHPLYCIAKQLKQSQTIKPGSLTYGLLEGQRVYIREAIQDLKTMEAWRKEARQVRDGERPHKQRAARKMPGGRKRAEPETGDAGDAQGHKEDLYGTWQTEEYVPPVATNGEIPTDAYGKVDLWGGNLKLLPGGCRHIEGPYIQKICNENQIKYKEAFVGFETKDRVPKPKLWGIVVLEEDYDRLQRLYAAFTAAKTAEKKDKRDVRLLKRWGELIKLVVQMRRVEQNYG